MRNDTAKVRRRLSEAGRRLANGVPSGTSTPLGDLDSLALHVIHAGGGEAEFYEIARESELPASNRDKALRDAWSFAESRFDPLTTGRPGGFRPKLEKLADRVFHSDQWSPRKSVTQRAVALGAVALCWRFDRTKVTMEERMLVEESGVKSRMTVRETRRALQDLGLLLPKERQPSGRWLQGIDLRWGEYPPEGKVTGVLDKLWSPEDTAKGHEVFVELGAVAGWVYHLLEPEQWYSVAEAAVCLSVSEKAVYSALRALKPHGLVETRHGGFRVIPASDDRLSAIADDLGVRDWKARMREAHQAERSDWHGWKQQHSLDSARRYSERRERYLAEERAKDTRHYCNPFEDCDCEPTVAVPPAEEPPF